MVIKFTMAPSKPIEDMHMQLATEVFADTEEEAREGGERASQIMYAFLEGFGQADLNGA